MKREKAGQFEPVDDARLIAALKFWKYREDGTERTRAERLALISAAIKKSKRLFTLRADAMDDLATKTFHALVVGDFPTTSEDQITIRSQSVSPSCMS